MSSNAAGDFIRLVVRVSDRQLADRVLAEADAAGASGAEERSDEGTLVLVLYAQAARVARSNAERNGLDPSAWCRRTDAGGDRWLGLVMRRPGGRANR